MVFALSLKVLDYYLFSFVSSFGVCSVLRARICDLRFCKLALKLFFNHVVDGVAASPPDPENGDPGLQLFMAGHGQIQCHYSVRLLLSLPRAGAFFYGP